MAKPVIECELSGQPTQLASQKAIRRSNLELEWKNNPWSAVPCKYLEILLTTCR